MPTSAAATAASWLPLRRVTTGRADVPASGCVKPTFTEIRPQYGDKLVSLAGREARSQPDLSYASTAHDAGAYSGS